MKNPLTCSAYHGRGKFYFNRTPKILDENLNEYLAENKNRMSTLLYSLEKDLEDKVNFFGEDMLENIKENRKRFSRDTPTLLKKSVVRKFINLFKILLHKETEVHQGTVHPILEMYSLMNEFYDKYYEHLRNDTFHEKLEKQIEENIVNDIKSEETEVYHVEGKEKYYFIKKYERNPKIRALALIKHGLNCYACGFNFKEVYGELGKDFIEVHHVVPLSSIDEEVVVNHETDLIPLCANCHRMVHRRKDNVLSIDELKELIMQHR